MTGGGDTPINKHWKYKFGSGLFIVGILNDEDYEYWTTDIPAVNAQDSLAFMFNAQGQAVDNINMTNELKNTILSALQSFYGFEVNDYNSIANWVSYGQYIEDWEEYQTINE